MFVCLFETAIRAKAILLSSSPPTKFKFISPVQGVHKGKQHACKMLATAYSIPHEGKKTSSSKHTDTKGCQKL